MKTWTDYAVMNGKQDDARSFRKKTIAIEYAQQQAMLTPVTSFRVYRVKHYTETGRVDLHCLINYWWDKIGGLQYELGGDTYKNV